MARDDNNSRDPRKRQDIGEFSRVFPTDTLDFTSRVCRRRQQFFVGQPSRQGRIGQAESGRFRRELRADPPRRGRVGEQDRPEPDVGRPGGDQLERVAPGGDAAHAHDRQARRRGAGIDGRERDRLERRARVAAHPACEPRPERPLVQREPAQRVHEREPIGAGGLDRTGDLREVPGCRRELRVDGKASRGPASGDDLGGALRRLVDVRAREVQLDGGDFVAA